MILVLNYENAGALHRIFASPKGLRSHNNATVFAVKQLQLGAVMITLLQAGGGTFYLRVLVIEGASRPS